jgi:exodeoxyribonuclease V alpha subunit
MSATNLTEPDPFDVRRVSGGSALLGEFNTAAVLIAADVHVATRLAALAGEADESVRLAAALAVRAPRLGHVHVDLAAVRDTAAVDADEPVDLTALPWPGPAAWIERVAASELVAVGEETTGAARPLRLIGTWLYLDRYWGIERQIAADLIAINQGHAGPVRPEVLADGLARLFAGQIASRQSLAAASAVLQRLSVIAGGPGTGKTTTVARIVALLGEQATAAGGRMPLVALAAPTGKAAARLQEAVHEEAATLDVAPAVRELLLGLTASTLHRLLGWRPGSHSRFRHDRNQRLPHDVVIVDETSMVSLSLMARLVEAVRPDARLVLVGDPGQLASIEAGAVLGDIVGPAGDRLRIGAGARGRLAAAVGRPVDADEPPPGVSIGDGIIVLDRAHRFGEGIGGLAAAIRRGDADAVVELLSAPPDDVTWIPVDVAEAEAEAALAPVRASALDAARAVVRAARAGRAGEAIAALRTFRVLCAHRRGPQGVATWTYATEGWLEAAVEGFSTHDRWYAGRPLLVTENDYELRLYNGDTGVVVRSGPDRVSAAFERGSGTIEFSPARLGAVETVYAMTIHKSQGSQFDTAAVLLPAPNSRILTRELLYTAVTRARTKVIVVGTEEMIRAGVQRPVARASGLRRRLWGPES